MDIQPRTYRDAEGTWYVNANGTRQRAPELVCPTCGASFISTPSGSRRFCSRACWRAICSRCGVTFQAGGQRAAYCSRACQMGARPCTECGREFTPSKNSRALFCSGACFNNSRTPVGTTRLVSGGYRIVKVLPGTPGIGFRVYGSNRHGWMLEHRYVMQQAVGRALEDHETVHHLNGIRDDNRLENLQLRSGHHGEGVARACGDCGSRNVVSVPI